MKNFNPIVVLASSVLSVTLIVPSLLVLPFAQGPAGGKLGESLSQTKANPKPEPAAPPSEEKAVEVSVYRSASGKIEKAALEDYLVGVVAAEMPADFKEEALKAQALTARTYIVKKMISNDTHGVPKGAQVNDTTANQVYLNDAQQRAAWGSDYNWKRKKILDAVRATSGQILTYAGEPITATFFSTSNGYTENSEDYWGGTYPYLRSVASPWDKNSPKFNSQQAIPVADFEAKLGVKVGSGPDIGKIVERTAGHRVGKVDFNGKVLSGKDIREKLGLRSSDFTWTRKGNSILITTKGYGHGVGMSQYGANGMAEAGKTYQQIVKYYYQGVAISNADTMLASMTAEK